MGTEQDTLPSAGVGGSGAAATSGGIAAGEKGQAAGGNIYNIDTLNVDSNPEALRWLVMKGIVPLMDMVGAPGQPWDLDFRGKEHISTLRRKLLRIKELKHPKLITVRGTLFPCALLSPGWWERDDKTKSSEPEWHNGLQKWLFYGFDLWGPSWDFSWSLKGSGTTQEQPFFIAQLGDGDEANSLPVVIPFEKAQRLRQMFAEGWGGLEVTIVGLLGHRRQFPKRGPANLDLVGGLLDYCIWLDEDTGDHRISIMRDKTDIYSGYLWKCVTPKTWFEQKPCLCIDDVYFLWEHTNFANRDAVKYNLDSLTRKEEYIQSMHGDLVLLQKSSGAVEGTPSWSTERFYDLLAGKNFDV
jgi:hypothetical protein